MADRPIIFSGPMIRALLEGRKTQTRRILKPQPPAWIYPDERPGYSCMTPKGSIEFRGVYIDPDGVDHGPAAKFIKLPYLKGDRLWVKETWQAGMTDNGPAVAYRADGDRFYPEFTGPDEGAGPSFDYEAHPAAAWKHGHWIPDVEAKGPWSSPLHTRRWASRITLLVTSVKVERLQSISEDDAQAEGARKLVHDGEGTFYEHERGTHICGFAGIWCHLNGADSWDANPWVIAPTFTVVRENIDRIPA